MRYFIYAVTTLLLAGCTQIISDESLRLVDRDLSFAELRREPERYNGRHLLLGGTIVDVRNRSNGSELELVQLKTDESGEIIDTASSAGRFIAFSPSLLDPAIYRPGLLVSLVGEVSGKRTMILDEGNYTYPILTISEIHIWKPEELRAPPSFHFGIGVGTYFH
ncbi:MAG: Slp family lipoprotein [Desulfuromonadaceae bacterium]|nr:Slp family lipoprotein [Desulfuromonadaceae bacterium]